LWDGSLKIYSNKDKKQQAYEELLVILKERNPNATVQDVKKKVNVYARILGRRRTKSNFQRGQGQVQMIYTRVSQIT
jgi:hypothetical protein